MLKYMVFLHLSCSLVFSAPVRAQFAFDPSGLPGMGVMPGDAGFGLSVSGSLNPSLLGNWSGNGGGDQTSDNVWYLGPQAVEYCIVRDPAYPLTEGELVPMVAASLNDWKHFFQRYGLDKKRFGTGPQKFHDGLPREMSLTFTPAVCPDPESAVDEKKLVFLFGGSNAVVDLYKQLYDEGSAGVAIRKSYDHTTYRNGGFIWLDDFSTNPDAIRHMLLHEIGHVFGMPHDSVFVMSSNVRLYTQSHEIFSEGLLGSIETPSWPYRLRTGDVLDLNTGAGFRKNASGDQCEAGETPVKRLPAEVREAFSLQGESCTRITLTLNKDSHTLQIGNQDSSIQLRGRFMTKKVNRAEPFPGPGLTTLWTVHREGDAGNKQAWGFSPIDPESGTHPLFGAFSHSRSQVNFPANIFQARGVSVEVYLGARQFWWTLTPELRRWEREREPRGPDRRFRR